MNFLFRSLLRKPSAPKRLFFNARFFKSSNNTDSEFNVEVLDLEQNDEESLKKKVQSTYVFIEKSLALPIEIPLFPFSKCSINLGETRSKVNQCFFINLTLKFQAFPKNFTWFYDSHCPQTRNEENRRSSNQRFL